MYDYDYLDDDAQFGSDDPPYQMSASRIAARGVPAQIGRFRVLAGLRRRDEFRRPGGEGERGP